MKFDKSYNIKQVKALFNEQFPYLKIEFYHHEHSQSEGSNLSAQYDENTLLSAINPDFTEAQLEINPAMSVGEFEVYFREKTGMNAQVFRKSNNLWLQTSSTDSWTLEKQNGKGERSMIDYDIDPVNISDFDVD